GLPSVLGNGPLGAGRPPRFGALGVPQFGALTRIHLTLLPSTAAVFIPSSLEPLRAYYRELGRPRVVDIHAAIEARADAKDYVLRVTMNDDCFSDPSRFPAGCRWLDSQAAIEANLSPLNIQRQDILLTSPLVYYNGQRVAR